MTTSAYSELYIEDAMNNLGAMFDYAINDCFYDADTFFSYFTASKLSKEFECGNPKYTVGMSGIELAQEVECIIFGKSERKEYSNPFDKSAEFWAGWSLCYFQWKTKRSFDAIQKAVPFSSIVQMYSPLHEANIEKFVDIMNEKIIEHTSKSRVSLAYFREASGFSQSELAKHSGVSLRMIQLYEQKQNDIKKAQTGTILALAKTLHCSVEELVGEG